MSKKIKNNLSKKNNSKQLREIKREILAFLIKNSKKEYNLKQICESLGKDKNPSQRLSVIEGLKNLVIEKQVICSNRGKYQVNTIEEYVEGKIDFNQSGNAYIVVEGLEKDIFIPKEKTKQALQHDTVKVLVHHFKNKKAEAEVVEIIKRNKTNYVGILEYNDTKNFGFVITRYLNTDIFIPRDSFNDAQNGEKVVVEIVSWSEKDDSPKGKIIQILGKPGENETEIHAILADYGLPYSFPYEVEEEAKQIDERISQEEILKRRDMRNVTTFTIDPLDAKDFDDALSIKQLENGNLEIGVHIADVSHYVKPGTLLDNEAYNRATSIYLVDRVVPMLPEILSNKVCSLRPNEEKYTFSSIFELDNNANLLNQWFGRTVINSDRRFTYEEAQEIIEGKDGDFAEEIKTLDKLAKIMREKRQQKGAISFDKIEVRFKLDENSYPVGVYLKESKDSNHLIEEFMLLANKKVSEFVSLKKDKTASDRTYIYRIHDDPNPDKLLALKQFVNTLGYDIKLDNKNSISKSLNKLLTDVHGKAEENMIETLAMRTMSKAKYSTENIGHYGLAFEYYTHFTSPIRRYPDIIAHRLLQDFLDKKPSANPQKTQEEAEHSSNMERLAADAERDSIKFMQVKFMEKHVGEFFNGIVSGVTEKGIYVEIKEFGAEGLVKLKDIRDDHYIFNEKSYSIIGQRTGNEYRLGDNVHIKIIKANLEKRQLDFEISD